MLFIKTVLYISVLVSYYFLGKKLNLTATTTSNNKAVYGGGLLFSVILLVESFPFSNSTFFIASILVLAILSFWDDIRPISPIFKLIVHLIIGFIASIFILKLNFKDGFFMMLLVTGFIIFYTNANNFMDGINGMMITNNILILLVLLAVNSFKFRFIENYLLEFLLFGALLFFVFNFRTRALLISGDVGSIVLGFVIVLFVLDLYFKTKNIFVFGLLITFSVETISTLILRISTNKNILISHEEHLYEILVIKKEIPALKVTLIYGVTQLIFSLIVLISFYYQLNNYVFYAILISYILIYLFLKHKVLNHAKGY